MPREYRANDEADQAVRLLPVAEIAGAKPGHAKRVDVGGFRLDGLQVGGERVGIARQVLVSRPEEHQGVEVRSGIGQELLQH